MSPSLESAHDDQYLIRYLLGQLSEEEAERLDEMSITDDETATRLRVVEDDLVDVYVRGALPAEVRTRFEQVYLASPKRRERVEFAQQFRRAVDRVEPAVSPVSAAAAPAPRAPVPMARPAAAPAPIARPAGRWLAWAAAILAVSCGGLLVEQLRLRSGLDDARQQNAALDAHAEDLAHQLAQAQQTTHAGTVPTPAQPRTEPAPAGGVATGIATAAALVLLPDTRAANAFPTLVVAPANRTASFTLRLEPGDFSRYDVALHDPATSRDIWRSGEIARRHDAAAPALQVTVPVALLKAQHYSFTVTASSATGRREVVGSYTFEVQR